MAPDDQLGAARRAFEIFARICARDEAPLYERICQGVAEDPELLALFARIPAAQRRPNLLLASAHDLLLAGTPGELAAFYPTVALYRSWKAPVRPPAPGPRRSDPSSGRPPWPADPAPAFVRFCAEHRGALEERLFYRATQTNEVGRCAILLPALSELGREVGRPLWLLELGASAGLNLLFDHFSYDYRPAPEGGRAEHTPAGSGSPEGAPGQRLGDPASPVHLRVEVRHGPLPALAFPELAGRAGLDQDPIDVRDQETARWLLACQWPDHPDRFSRLLGAIEVQRRDLDPPLVERGDMVDDLEGALAAVPGDAHLCVLHTWAAAYLSPARQLDLTAALTAFGHRRPLTWLFAEDPYEVPALPLPRPPAGRSAVPASTVLVRADLDGSTRGLRRLADVHHHGRWLHWWAPPAAPAPPAERS